VDFSAHAGSSGRDDYWIGTRDDLLSPNF
jgi:hypothetical protein